MKTKGAQLAAALKKRPMTYLEMQMLGISTSPHKRVREWLDQNIGWKLSKKMRGDGLVMWRVVRAA